MQQPLPAGRCLVPVLLVVVVAAVVVVVVVVVSVEVSDVVVLEL